MQLIPHNTPFFELKEVLRFLKLKHPEADICSEDELVDELDTVGHWVMPLGDDFTYVNPQEILDNMSGEIFADEVRVALELILTDLDNHLDDYGRLFLKVS